MRKVKKGILSLERGKGDPSLVKGKEGDPVS